MIQFWKIPANGGRPEGFVREKYDWRLMPEGTVSASDKRREWGIRDVPISDAADKWLVRTGENQYTIADDRQLTKLRLEEHFADFPDEAKKKKLVEMLLCTWVYWPEKKNVLDTFTRDFTILSKGESLGAAFEALRDKNWPEALRLIPAEFWGEAAPTDQPEEKSVGELVKEGKDMEARIQAARQKSFANIGSQPEPPRPKLYLVVADGFGSKQEHVIATDPTEAERKSGLRNVKSITVVSESPIL